MDTAEQANPAPLLKINDAAQLLNCSPSNVRSLIAKGLISVIATGATGKGFRIEPGEVERFIEERRTCHDPARTRSRERTIKLKYMKA